MTEKLRRLVLFVCVENTFRSVIAEAMFNHYAPSAWRAESAGVKAAAEINPVAVQVLGEIEIRIADKKPRLVTPQLVTDASRIVIFGCVDRCLVGAKEKSEDWPIPGSVGKDGSLRPREELLVIRGEIERRALKLIHELGHASQTE